VNGSPPSNAQGDKQSNIIRAQGEKQSQILEAQGDAISTVLRAKSAESMGERAIIEKGMETLEGIGEGESNTFVIPQELSSLVGRYGKHLAGSDVSGDGTELDSLDFDVETRELIGLDDIDEILNQISQEADVDPAKLEEKAEAVQRGEDAGLKDADAVIDEMDAELDGEEGAGDTDDDNAST